MIPTEEARLITETEARIVAIVRDAMAQGYGPPARKVDRCEHSKFGWEDCISCYDDHLDRVLDAVLRGDHRKDQTNAAGN